MLRTINIGDLTIVDESAQVGGSFKSRGTAAAITDRMDRRPLVTFSSGNHGVAVALLARQWKRRALVAVPDWAEPDKIQLLEKLGCVILRAGNTALACERKALDLVAEHDGELLHPYRSRRQIGGYASLWDEIVQVIPNGADIVVPVGAGALLASGVLYRMRTSARYHVIGAEPSACATLGPALSAGRPTVLESRSLVAPALNVNVSPEEVLELVSGTADLDLYQVSDEEMSAAALIMEMLGMQIDPAASAGVACVLFRSIRRRFRNLVVIITGRGAQVSAARLREDGVLGFSDAELSSIAPKSLQIIRRNILTSPLVRLSGITDEKYSSSRHRRFNGRHNTNEAAVMHHYPAEAIGGS